jgi:O-succinylbenzoate synthase
MTHETLVIKPDLAGLLADYLREALATAEDQAWFWINEWQAGEREAEADLAAGRYQVFDTMDDLIADLGWPQ